jgi:hypothetical protein
VKTANSEEFVLAIVNCGVRELSVVLQLIFFIVYRRPYLWSSGQSSWLHIQISRVRFPALPDLLRSSGSGTGSTQPREDN